MMKKIRRKLAFALCVCILVAASFCVPASAARYTSLAWSTSTTNNKYTITGFAGQPMSYAYAKKSGPTSNITVTGYVESICIDEYSLMVTECISVTYEGDTSTYKWNSSWVSTTTRQSPLTVSRSYSDFEESRFGMMQIYTVNINQSYGEMTVKSTCPYPQNMYYTDYITLPYLTS